MRAAVIRGFAEQNKYLKRIVEQNDVIIDQLKRLDQPLIEITKSPEELAQPVSDLGTLD